MTADELLKKDENIKVEKQVKSFMTEENILKKLTQNDNEFIKLAFKLTEDSLIRSNVDIINSGTTLAMVIIINDIIISANAGDSRAIAVFEDKTIYLTNDHKPELPSEMKRIIEMGGDVNTMGGKEIIKTV